MPEYLAPGVYIEEVSTGPKPIEGVSTSTAGFVGPTERGWEPPRLLTSFTEYQKWYGGFIPNVSYLAYAVKGFFDNGGKRCFVARIVNGKASRTADVIGNLEVLAVGRGAWGNNIAIKIDNGTQNNVDQGGTNDWFRVSILYFRDGIPEPLIDPTSRDPEVLANPNRREPEVLETYDNLTHVSGGTNDAVTVINVASKLVRVRWNAPGPARPENQDFTRLLVQKGDDGDPISAGDYTGDRDPQLPGDPDELLGRGSGLAAIEEVDQVALLVAPDEVRDGLANVTTQVINQCQILRDRFAIVSVERGQNDVANLRPPKDTDYAAFYYPWIRIFDASTNNYRLIPPSGHVAGIFARTDIERGVHKAPANAVVRGATDLEFPVTKGMQDLLNPVGVNAIRDFRGDGRGIRLWGARTMTSDSEWKYINVRRLFIFAEESVEEATQWVVFEPNDYATWARVVRSITNFLVRVWKNGALMGLTQEEAFFVRCDRTTMTQDDIDNGRLICLIGMAPVKPAEFVIFRFSQKTADAA